MKTNHDYHLTYCTNIHPGENWEEVFTALKANLPPVKEKVSPTHPFGIGLRLSDLASRQLLQKNHLAVLKSWLIDQNFYVFTMNGFPYGDFHRRKVKDLVHKPDWTTTERRDYSLRLFNILSELLPEGMEGGISTSPLSYKPWFKHNLSKRKTVLRKASVSLAQVVAELIRIKIATGKMLHLDIEPEPDGLIENTNDILTYFSEWLLPIGVDHLCNSLALSTLQAEEAIKSHIQLCYDVCHFAVVYEHPERVFQELAQAGIRIGKIQISAALKADFPRKMEDKHGLHDAFSTFNESTYLHQVIARDEQNNFMHYSDLTEALQNFYQPGTLEWRTHFHVPIFLNKYHKLQSTQEDILTVLNLLKSNKITNHLEVETYTWTVLPQELQTELIPSIVRELQWVKKNMKKTP